MGAQIAALQTVRGVLFNGKFRSIAILARMLGLLRGFKLKNFQCAARRILLGFFFAFAFADGEDAFADMATNLEYLAVIRTDGADDGVVRRDAAHFLSGVLERGLGIGVAAGFGA